MLDSQAIPLRLVLNSNCNGHCHYCHREGVSTDSRMPTSIVQQCAYTAKELSLPITLTGGEPSLREDLSTIINGIFHIDPTLKINLTSNGYNLASFNDLIQPIDTLNLSITSFQRNVAQQYQNVPPDNALHALHLFPAHNKNLNVVVGKDNFAEIDNIIEYCIKSNFGLDIMFELKRYTKQELQIQRLLFAKLEKNGNMTIDLKLSPTIQIVVNERCRIRVKHPWLSSLPQIGICSKCEIKKNCFERICAIRVFPNGQVSPCLAQEIESDKATLDERIKDLHSRIASDISLLSFMAIPSAHCELLDLI
jgi:Radical SAM superfamily.